MDSDKFWWLGVALVIVALAAWQLGYLGVGQLITQKGVQSPATIEAPAQSTSLKPSVTTRVTPVQPSTNQPVPYANP
jgi:multidrug resistance efflux pump